MDTKRSILTWLNKMSAARLLLLFYFLAIILSTILLSLLVAYKPDVDLAFMSILFTAFNSLSVTWVNKIKIIDTLSVTGYFFLMIILQLGAVGIMASVTFIWLLLGKKIGFRERQLIMTDQNQTTFSGMVQLIKEIIYVVLLIELAGFLI